jgi:hypothetical protein
VSVVGSPGLGKTRLAEELAAALGERATTVWGRCDPTGEGIIFAPVVEVLHGAAGIGEADPEPLVRAKLAALVPDDPDVELSVERAASIPGFGAPAPAAETFWAGCWARWPPRGRCWWCSMTCTGDNPHFGS